MTTFQFWFFAIPVVVLLIQAARILARLNRIETAVNAHVLWHSESYRANRSGPISNQQAREIEEIQGRYDAADRALTEAEINEARAKAFFPAVNGEQA
jgi:hypothetical protein